MAPKFTALVSAGALLAAGCASAPYPPPHLLGVRVGMPKAEVEGLLERKHALARDDMGPGGAKQNWELDHESFHWLVLRYTPDLEVQWATVQTRPGGKAVRFRDLGKLENAVLVGQYIYRWDVPADDGGPAYNVIARGTDPEELFSISLFSPQGGEPVSGDSPAQE